MAAIYINPFTQAFNEINNFAFGNSNNQLTKSTYDPLPPINNSLQGRVQIQQQSKSGLMEKKQPTEGTVEYERAHEIRSTDDNLIIENNVLNVEKIQTQYQKDKEEEFFNSTVSDIDNDSILQPFVFFPHYKVSDYSNDIVNWRKQVNPYGTKGFFFFKVFFNFRTNYGLLGGILNDSHELLTNTNTAYGYLNQIAGMGMYDSENLTDRIKALQKFVNGLYVVSEKTPWFFKEVNNINNINDVPMIEEDFNNQSIDIICSEESVDMRLGTLFNLYKFACYNSMRNKEIIPANLRRFEMSILFMHVPLRIHQTRWKDFDKNTIAEKELNFNKDATQIMSVKMLTFQNCEFDVKSMNDVAEQTSNEMAFDLGKSTIKINYSRVFEHRINEWERFGFGQDGFIFDLSDETRPDGDRLNKIANAIENNYYSPRRVYNYDPTKIRNREGIPVSSENYFGRNVSAPESLTLRHNTMYYNKKLQDLRNVKFNSDNLYGNFTKVRSIYYLNKLKASKEGTIDHGNIYGADFGRTGVGRYRKNSDYLDEKLTRIKYGTISGNLYDYDYGIVRRNGKVINTPYLVEKLNRLKKGTISGNLYDYDYGVVHSDGKATKTPYLTEKLNRLKKGTISGNLYDYDYGVVHSDGKATKTPYLVEKLDRIKKGTVSGNLYDYEYGVIHKDGTTTKSQYLTEKLNRIKNGGILDIPNDLAVENEFNEHEYFGNTIPHDLAIENEFKERKYFGNIIPHELAVANEFKETEYAGNIVSNDLAVSNSFKEREYNGNTIPESLATPNTFTLKWSANALNNSNNMYAVDGNPSTKHTWLGKLIEGTWQRIKGIYRF